MYYSVRHGDNQSVAGCRHGVKLVRLLVLAAEGGRGARVVEVDVCIP
jgi:hypothetical protein